jgi:hypothetical protein
VSSTFAFISSTALGLLQLLGALADADLEVLAVRLERLVGRREVLLPLDQLDVEGRRRPDLLGELLLQPAHHGAGEDEEAAPGGDVRVDVARRAPDLEGLGEEDDVDADHQRAQERAEHRAAPAQVVAGHDDRQEVEVQEGELRGDEVVDARRAQERYQDEQVLEVRQQVALGTFHDSVARRRDHTNRECPERSPPREDCWWPLARTWSRCCHQASYVSRALRCQRKKRNAAPATDRAAPIAHGRQPETVALIAR